MNWLIVVIGLVLTAVSSVVIFFVTQMEYQSLEIMVLFGLIITTLVYVLQLRRRQKKLYILKKTNEEEKTKEIKEYKENRNALLFLGTLQIILYIFIMILGYVLGVY